MEVEAKSVQAKEPCGKRRIGTGRRGKPIGDRSRAAA
jgi:hypothetical protein